ncbi:MAG: type III-A CRISPR-associated RAMP protein Csm5 [Euryarchaeota archaeon]|nr:type III-A CRISPR-associated RAMP protein Csm5 [Euryarchaeota archaeon]
MICELDAIAPVHIGTGISYNRVEFVIKNDTLHRISMRKLIDRLSGREIDNLTSQLERGSFSIEGFLQRTDVEPGEVSIYSLECKMVPKEVREQIKTANKVYIPGSSVKGAIRGALLYWHLKTNDWMVPVCYLKEGEISGYTNINLLDLIRGSVQRFSDGKPVPIEPSFKEYREDVHKNRFGNRFVDMVFGMKPFGSKRGDIRPTFDAKYDLLKFLHISDFMPVDVWLSAVNLKTYSLKRENLEAKRYSATVEAVRGRFSGTISLSSQVYTALENVDEYPLLRERMEILGLKDDFHDEEVLKHLKTVLRDYNSWCIEKEIELVSSADNGNRFVEGLEELERLNRSDNLIRVGFGVGTMYQTLIKLIEEEDAELAKNIVNKLKLGKFRRDLDRRTGTGLSPPYPKSIEFTDNDEPTGWLRWE